MCSSFLLRERQQRPQVLNEIVAQWAQEWCISICCVIRQRLSIDKRLRQHVTYGRVELCKSSQEISMV